MGSGVQGFEFLGPKNSDVNQQTSGTSTTTNNFDSTAKKSLDDALTSDQYSKDAAVKDASAAANYTMTQILQTGMPQISSAAGQSGGYNSTTKDMLSNDLSAKTSAAGQQVLLDTISKYANANSTDINARTAAVAATSGKTVTNDASTEQQNRSAGALWDSMNPGNVAGGRYGGGDNGGQGSNGTVICTQMFLDGHLDRQEYCADNRYVRNNFSYTTVKGYRFWAVPFVSLMRKSKIAYAIGKFIGVRWSKHCASYYIPTNSRNITGYIMCTVGAGICNLIGRVVKDTEFKSLWEASVYNG